MNYNDPFNLNSRGGGGAAKPTEAQHKRNLQKLAQLCTKTENRLCADCALCAPEWASVNIGCFVCIRCSGLHRQLGTHITKVRSTRMDMWQPDQIATMELNGNERVNRIYEAKLSRSAKKSIDMTNDQVVFQFIKSKYELKQWYQRKKKKKKADGTDEKEMKKKKKKKKKKVSSSEETSDEDSEDESSTNTSSSEESEEEIKPKKKKKSPKESPKAPAPPPKVVKQAKEPPPREEKKGKKEKKEKKEKDGKASKKSSKSKSKEAPAQDASPGGLDAFFAPVAAPSHPAPNSSLSIDSFFDIPPVGAKPGLDLGDFFSGGLAPDSDDDEAALPARGGTRGGALDLGAFFVGPLADTDDDEEEDTNPVRDRSYTAPQLGTFRMEHDEAKSDILSLFGATPMARTVSTGGLSAAPKKQELFLKSSATAPNRTSPVLKPSFPLIKPSSPVLKPVSPVQQVAPSQGSQPPPMVADMGQDLPPPASARERAETSLKASVVPGGMHPDDVAVMAAEQKATEALTKERAERVQREKEASSAKAKSDAEAATVQQAAIMAAIAQATMAATADQTLAQVQQPLTEAAYEATQDSSTMAEVNQAALACVQAATHAESLAEAEQAVKATQFLGDDDDDDDAEGDLAKEIGDLTGLKLDASPPLRAAEGGPDLGGLDDFDCGDLDDGFLSD